MSPFLLLFLLFLVLELFVFVQVSSAIGFFLALLLIVLGSMLGVLVLRAVGLVTALHARESLNRGELPTQTMLQGLTMALAGGLLILPGFMSDIVGLVMLLPFTRKLLVGKMRRHARADGLQPRGGPAPRRPLKRESDVIEGEFEYRDSK